MLKSIETFLAFVRGLLASLPTEISVALFILNLAIFFVLVLMLLKRIKETFNIHSQRKKLLGSLSESSAEG